MNSQMPPEKKKSKIVLASGVFDLLHLGHVKFLEEAKKVGGKNAELVVIVARDSTVEDTKDRKPIMPENQRRALVESLKIVDMAILGSKNLDLDNVIKIVKPDIITLGYDQTGMESRVKEYVKSHKLNIKVVRVGKFEADELNSSSKIRQKIVEKSSR